MTIPKATILTLTFLLSVCVSFGQTENDTKKLTVIQQDSLWEKLQDSLNTEFYKQPKLIKLTFEKNGKMKPFNGRFFISVDSNEFELKPNSLGHYEVDFTVDTSQTIILKFLHGRDTFTQQLSRPTEIKNGATIVFGVLTDVHKQSKMETRITRNEEDELSRKDDLYNSFFHYEEILD
ncbi:MAG: hypothetical protein M3Q97_02765, partial [Bacteroidota bacterium]|nr:hypothetical protein [Bacteroidota bacterium]